MTHNPGRLKHTCAGCPRYWTGLSMCHCSVCHNTFGSIKSFDRHRVWGECRHPQELNLNYNIARGVWSEHFSWDNDPNDDDDDQLGAPWPSGSTSTSTPPTYPPSKYGEPPT